MGVKICLGRPWSKQLAFGDSARPCVIIIRVGWFGAAPSAAARARFGATPAAAGAVFTRTLGTMRI